MRLHLQELQVEHFLQNKIINLRGISGRWAGWAIAHPGFGPFNDYVVVGGQKSLFLAHSEIKNLQIEPCGSQKRVKLCLHND